MLVLALAYPRPIVVAVVSDVAVVIEMEKLRSHRAVRIRARLPVSTAVALVPTRVPARQLVVIGGRHYAAIGQSADVVRR